MANSFTIDVDGAAMREALEGESLKMKIRDFVKAAARISADNIASEAKQRVARRTGQTAQGVVVKSDKTGWGWNVKAGNTRMPMLDYWLEHGTVHMAARPFFYESARIEANAHERRVAAAIQAALSEYGLGPGQR